MMSYVGRSVIVIGKCAGVLQEGVYSIIASDGTVIRAEVPPNEYIEEGAFVQLSGKVTPHGVLVCMRMNKIKAGFDVGNYEKALALMNSAKYMSLFNP
jgi:hypothetical protein